jgi:hypothetical protein
MCAGRHWKKVIGGEHKTVIIGVDNVGVRT